MFNGAVESSALQCMLSRRVLNLFLKMLTFGDDFMSSGNEFHRTGAADEKAS